jgi:hypothetical protein
MKPFRLQTSFAYQRLRTITTKQGGLQQATIPATPPSTPQPFERVDQQLLNPAATPLALLPLSSIIRTYTITTVAASPILMSFTSSILHRMLNSKSVIFNVDRNPILHWLLKKTFYAQFCAGENKAEVQKLIKDVEAVGYSGIALEYAMEVLEDEDGHAVDESSGIQSWKNGVMETIELSKEDSFLAFKSVLSLFLQKPLTDFLHQVLWHGSCSIQPAQSQ